MRRLVVRCPRLLFTIVVGDGDERPRHDPVQQIGLPRLERDQPAEHVEEVKKGPRYIRRATRPAGFFRAARAAACRQSAACCGGSAGS